MEKIDEQLKNISFVDVPVSVHQSIMKKVTSCRMQPFFIAVFCFLSVVFFMIAWHINTKLIEAEFSDMLADLLSDFNMSFYLFSTIVKSFFEIISPVYVLSLIFSFAGAVYLAKKIIHTQFQRI